ncbi:MAG: hypothetical protein ACRD09_01305 [Vicinamibacterales bacterium]
MRFAAVFCLALAALTRTGWGVAGGQVGSPEPQSQVAAGPRVVVRADPRVVQSFVPAAQPRLRTRESLATITVLYTGFTPQAQAAFQHAMNIWASQLTTSVPIQIEAEFTTLGSGVLGSAGPWLVRNAPGLMANMWYPVALANKLTGTDRLPTTSDIDASFNSSFAWYFGTDGLAPAGTYDFVTVVLHELGHGLGFVGSMSYNAGSGSWGFSGSPLIYDHFTENGAGQGLLVAFANPSAALGSQLTSNNLYFDGPRTRLANGGSPARIYAPASWQGGSSYSHLNEQTYPAGNPSSLMTPQLASSEAIHDPGPIGRGVLEDIGWTVGVGVLTTPSNLRVIR